MIEITVILTVFNRREKTLECLERLLQQAGLGQSFKLGIVVVDDNSTDGTPQAVSQLFPDVKLIPGSGSLFWSGGMALAESTAIQENPDFLLWVNDDVQLDPDAISRAVDEQAHHDGPVILVGAMRSIENEGSVTYTGSRLRSRRPGSLVPLLPTEETQPIDAFNGNFVLVPRAVYQALRGIDAKFVHAYGDIDYGLRAKNRGFSSLLLPGSVGICELNRATGTWQDTSLSRFRRAKELFGRKAYPPRPHWRFNLRHGGILGPSYFLASYARGLSLIVRARP